MWSRGGCGGASDHRATCHHCHVAAFNTINDWCLLSLHCTNYDPSASKLADLSPCLTRTAVHSSLSSVTPLSAADVTHHQCQTYEWQLVSCTVNSYLTRHQSGPAYPGRYYSQCADHSQAISGGDIWQNSIINYQCHPLSACGIHHGHWSQSTLIHCVS